MACRRPCTPASYALLVLAVWAVCGAFAQPVHPAADRHLTKGAQGAVHRRLLNSSTPAAATNATKPLAGTGNSTAGHGSQTAPAAKAPELAGAGGPKDGPKPQALVKAVAQHSPETKQLPVLAAAHNSSEPKQQQANQTAAAHSQHSTKPQPAAAVQVQASGSTKAPAAAASPSTGASVSTAHSPSASSTQTTQMPTKQDQHTPQPSNPTKLEEDKSLAPSTQNLQATAPTAAELEPVAVAAALAEDYEVVPEAGQAPASDAAVESQQPAEAVDAVAEGDMDTWAVVEAAEPSSASWADSWDDAGDAAAEGVDANDGTAPTEEWSVTWTSTVPSEDAAWDTDDAAGDAQATADDLAAADSDVTDAADADTASAGEVGEAARLADSLLEDDMQAQGQQEGEHSGSKLLLAASNPAAQAFVATAASYRSRSVGSSRKVSPAKANPYSFLFKPKKQADEEEDAVAEWFKKNKIKPKVSKPKPYTGGAKKQAAPYSSSSGVLADNLYDASSDSELHDQGEAQARHTRRTEDVPQKTRHTSTITKLSKTLSIVGDEKWRLINIEREEDIRWLAAGVREYNKNHDKPVFVLAWVP